MSRSVITRTVSIISAEEQGRQKTTLPREIPFEIQLRAGRRLRTVANITRTPGNDYELAAGRLFGEGFIHNRHDFSHMTYCMDESALQEYNLLTVVLHSRQMPQPPQPEQMVVEGVSCGVSSQSLLEALQQRALQPIPDGPTLGVDDLLRVIDHTTDRPEAGAATAALFTPGAELRVTRHDVDPRNALDKLVGWGVLNDHLPFHGSLVWLNDRATFAVVQRCAVAGVPLLLSSGRPSSLAVSVATRHNITLLRHSGDQVTVYSGEERLHP